MSMLRSAEKKIIEAICSHRKAYEICENVKYCPTCGRYQVNDSRVYKPGEWLFSYERNVTQGDEFDRMCVEAGFANMAGDTIADYTDAYGDSFSNLKWQRDVLLETLVNSYPGIWRKYFNGESWFIGCVDPDTHEVLCSFKMSGDMDRFKCVESEFNTAMKRYDDLTKIIPHISEMIEKARVKQFTAEEVDKLLEAKEKQVREEIEKTRIEFLDDLFAHVGRSVEAFFDTLEYSIKSEKDHFKTDVITARAETISPVVSRNVYTKEEIDARFAEIEEVSDPND